MPGDNVVGERLEDTLKHAVDVTKPRQPKCWPNKQKTHSVKVLVISFMIHVSNSEYFVLKPWFQIVM